MGTARTASFLPPPSATHRARMITLLATLQALLQLPWQHGTASPWHGLPPRGSESRGQNTCSLQTLGSRSWDAGRRGECWGWALSWLSLRGGALPALLLRCLLTPSWVCLWPGRAADAACRSPQAGRGGLPAADSAGKGRGSGRAPATGFVPHRPPAQPLLRGRWESGEGAQGGVTHRSTEEFAGSPRSRRIKAPGRALRARKADGGIASRIARPLSKGLWEPLCQRETFPFLAEEAWHRCNPGHHSWPS